jgi:hypothetical protein
VTAQGRGHQHLPTYKAVSVRIPATSAVEA